MDDVVRGEIINCGVLFFIGEGGEAKEHGAFQLAQNLRLDFFLQFDMDVVQFGVFLQGGLRRVQIELPAEDRRRPLTARPDIHEPSVDESRRVSAALDFDMAWFDITLFIPWFAHQRLDAERCDGLLRIAELSEVGDGCGIDG